MSGFFSTTTGLHVNPTVDECLAEIRLLQDAARVARAESATPEVLTEAQITEAYVASKRRARESTTPAKHPDTVRMEKLNKGLRNACESSECAGLGTLPTTYVVAMLAAVMKGNIS